MIPIITIEGATATGKTQLALQIAERLDAEIISADSRQVYQYLDIGTAKPSASELAKVKHHLISIITPDQKYNAGLFSKQALEICHKLRSQNKIPIVCGGTGLYVKALLEGLFPADVHNHQVRLDLEKELQANGLEQLYAELANVDPFAAQKINCRDKQRILRALEVFKASGLPISQHWQKQNSQSELFPFKIYLTEERQILYKRINGRVEAMLKADLLEEIRSVLAKGYSWSDPGFNTVGYKEFQPYFEGSADLASCVHLAQQHTRNYAKRQLTWYRKCNFHLSEAYSSINLDNVLLLFKKHIENMSRGE
ncbi:MAG: tRNA (adenosine(37)-N6)-dimethylallyltransferase MiaA [Candidatus Cloacimonadaceae bacterium]